MEANNQTNTDTKPTVVTPEVDVTTPATEAVSEPVAETSSAAEVTDAVTATTITPDVVEVAAVAAPVLPAASMRNQLIKQYGIAALIVLIMGAGLMYMLEQQGRIDTKVFDSLTTLVNPEPSAATVNGVKISLADFEKNRTQLTQAAEQQGNDTTNETIVSEIKTQALDLLINTELLRQAAGNAGVVVTPEDIDARYEEIKAGLGSEEELISRMAELGITTESLRKDIEGEILIKTHLTAAIDTTTVTVSEEEIVAGYAQVSGGAAGAEVPPLDEVRPQLEAQLRFNKEQELINTYITELRDAASIEVLI